MIQSKCLLASLKVNFPYLPAKIDQFSLKRKNLKILQFEFLEFCKRLCPRQDTYNYWNCSEEVIINDQFTSRAVQQLSRGCKLGMKLGPNNLDVPLREWTQLRTKLFGMNGAWENTQNTCHWIAFGKNCFKQGCSP